MKRIMIVLVVIASFIGIGNISSCNKAELLNNQIEFHGKISGYGIYTGVAGSLAFTDSYKSYELLTPLFSDYAEKQRLIKLPVGATIRPVNDGLPDFPDSTIIVKTFFYYNNRTDTARGKKIIETRLLIKQQGKWNAAAYIWNQAQTDASLLSTGADVPMNWIDENHKPQVIAYHIPSNVECGMCHGGNKDISPLGLKLRNLNVNINYNGVLRNQLVHLQNEGFFTSINPSDYASLPDWRNSSFSVEQRARAYLDVNCGHCHHSHDQISGSSLKLTYQTSLEDSKIKKYRKAIGTLMSRGAMPLLGTTMVDDEGLKLVEAYLQTFQ